MLNFEYNLDQVKYFTRIREFEYLRPNPQMAKAKINPLAMLSLPLPTNMPGDSYNEVVREFDLGEVGTSVDLIQKGINTASTEEKIMTGITGAGIGLAFGSMFGQKTRLGDLVGLVTGGSVGLDFVSSFAGMTRNPHTAMIFDRMGIRHYNLNFLLAPRSFQQSANLNTILSHLRSKMHPSFMQGNAFVLNYPSMFTIEFAGFPPNAMGIPNISFSFLRGMSINASPQGQVYFKDGWPSLVEVSLDFVELESKTREYFNRPMSG
jgi:hypothetical protein